VKGFHVSYIEYMITWGRMVSFWGKERKALFHMLLLCLYISQPLESVKCKRL
jgi:hypothetical protein